MAERKCSPATGSGGAKLGPKWEETSVAGKSFGYIKVVRSVFISDQLHPYSTSKPLRSSQTRLKTESDAAFEVVGLDWNALPLTLCSSVSLDAFKKQLKTY